MEVAPQKLVKNELISLNVTDQDIDKIVQARNIVAKARPDALFVPFFVVTDTNDYVYGKCRGSEIEKILEGVKIVWTS